MIFLAISFLCVAFVVICTAVYDVKSNSKIQKFKTEYGVPITVEEIDRNDYDELNVQVEDSLPILSGVIVIPPNKVEKHDDIWISQNLFRVESYESSGEGIYDVTLVNIEPAKVFSFDVLRQIFMSVSYSDYNNYALVNGVNCQGMVNYIADWCDRNEHTYAVEYYEEHVAIRVLHDNIWYRFDFTRSPSITVIEEE